MKNLSWLRLEGLPVSDAGLKELFPLANLQHLNLRSTRVSPRSFADFNSAIGGADLDLNITKARTAADPIALDRLYRTGAIDSANNLNKVAIIDLRGPDPGAFHDVYRTYAMRARLMRNFGTAANQVLWRGQAPLIGDPSFADDAERVGRLRDLAGS